MRCSYFLFLFLSLPTLFLCDTSATSLPYYIAAVVEHNPNPQPSSFPITREDADLIVYKNLLIYEQHMQNASSQGAQIIVFNEYGLFGDNFNTRDEIFPFLEMIPNLGSVPINPCQNSLQYAEQPAVVNISCLAMKYDMYVVVDMGDVQPCNETDKTCPKDKRYQYNTQVAFAPDGELIAKYHKMHLYEEPYYDTPPSNPTYFDTNFGVRFGMMICFDMLFTDPARMYFDNNVTDVVFSTEWENEFPIMSALMLQQGWSRVFESNLLASGTGVGYESSGSGIYSNGELLATFFNPNNATSDDRLLVAKVPKIISNYKFPDLDSSATDLDRVGSNLETLAPSNLKLMVDGMLVDKHKVRYAHMFEAEPGKSKSGIVGTSGSLTCNFSYSISSQSNGEVEKYVLYVYEGNDSGAFQICGIVHCGSSFGKCGETGHDLQASTVFDSFSITGTFDSSFTSFPLLSSNNNQLLPPSKLNFTQNGMYSTDFGEVLLSAVMILYNKL